MSKITILITFNVSKTKNSTWQKHTSSSYNNSKLLAAKYHMVSLKVHQTHGDNFVNS